MQSIQMIAFTVILLVYLQNSLYAKKIPRRKDAKGKFNDGKCCWREEHATGSQRGFSINCRQPIPVHCTYQGAPHKCNFYDVKVKNRVPFYECLADDSLKNAENACSKNMIQCYKECEDDANFYKVQSRFRRAVQEQGTNQQCWISSQDDSQDDKVDDKFDISKLGEYIKRPAVIASIAGGVVLLLLISCTIICCKRR